jgi:hypothetical protein
MLNQSIFNHVEILNTNNFRVSVYFHFLAAQIVKNFLTIVQNVSIDLHFTHVKKYT